MSYMVDGCGYGQHKLLLAAGETFVLYCPAQHKWYSDRGGIYMPRWQQEAET